MVELAAYCTGYFASRSSTSCCTGACSPWLPQTTKDCRRLIDGARCRSRRGADFSRHRRRACSLPQVQVGVGAGVWADVRQISVGRDQTTRQQCDIAVRRRDDAGLGLRSSPEHAAFDKSSWLKAWAMQIAKRRGMARRFARPWRARLAVIMHRISIDGAGLPMDREVTVA